MFFVPTKLTELLYPLQDGNTPLDLAARGGHTTCVERLLSTPGIDVNIINKVSGSTICYYCGGGKRGCEFMFENSAMMYMSGKGLNITLG